MTSKVWGCKKPSFEGPSAERRGQISNFFAQDLAKIEDFGCAGMVDQSPPVFVDRIRPGFDQFVPGKNDPSK